MILEICWLEFKLDNYCFLSQASALTSRISGLGLGLELAVLESQDFRWSRCSLVWNLSRHAVTDPRLAKGKPPTMVSGGLWVTLRGANGGSEPYSWNVFVHSDIKEGPKFKDFIFNDILAPCLSQTASRSQDQSLYTCTFSQWGRRFAHNIIPASDSADSFRCRTSEVSNSSLVSCRM